MIGLALAKLAANQKIMNIVFVVYGVLTLTIFISGLLFAVNNGSATPFSWAEATIPNFAVAGFLYGTVLLYLLGVETPYNMGAEFLSVRKSGPKMILWGSTALVAIYLLTTLGTMMALPGDQIDPVTGVIGMLDVAGFPGLMEIGAVVLAFIIIVALMTYQVAYSRLIFVSGLERHLPRIFTHLNPRTRNPVTAILIQGVLSSLILVGAVLAEQHGQRHGVSAGRTEHRVVVVRVLLPRPGAGGAQTLCRSLCRRGVLADSRRHGGGVDHRHRRIAGHRRRHLLLVRHPLDRCAAGDLDDVGGQHQPGHVRPRPDRLHLRSALGSQGLPGRRTGPPGRFRSHQDSGGHRTT